MNFDKELDASGLPCPMPIVKTKKTLSGMASGQLLRVWSTDGGTLDDMPTFAKHAGHQLLASGEEGGRYFFVLKKA